MKEVGEKIYKIDIRFHFEEKLQEMIEKDVKEME